MNTTISSKAPSYSTDPVAAAVTASFEPAAFRYAERAAELPAAAARPLDIDRLYPNLAVAERPASHTVLAVAVRSALAVINFIAAGSIAHPK